MTPDDIELSLIREFSVGDNQIGKSASRGERRERIRQGIYANDRKDDSFHGEGISYSEAFRTVFHERLDRRAATRESAVDATCVNCGHRRSQHDRVHRRCNACPCKAFQVSSEDRNEDDETDEGEEHG